MTHDTIITAAMIEAEEARMLAESYEEWMRFHESEAARYEAKGDHLHAAIHRKQADVERAFAVAARERARRIEAESEVSA